MSPREVLAGLTDDCDMRCEGCGWPVRTGVDAYARDNAGWTWCLECAPTGLLAPGDPEAVQDR